MLKRSMVCQKSNLELQSTRHNLRKILKHTKVTKKKKKVTQSNQNCLKPKQSPKKKNVKEISAKHSFGEIKIIEFFPCFSLIRYLTYSFSYAKKNFTPRPQNSNTDALLNGVRG